MILFALAVGYLIGSISPSRLVARGLTGGSHEWRRPSDQTEDLGSDAYTGVSTLAVLEQFGARWGALVAVLDGLKALIPTLAARMMFDEQEVALAVALGVIAGHVWPLYHRFHGGRGQASTIGALLVIDPLGLLVMVLAGAVLSLTVFTSIDLARNLYPVLAFPWFLTADGWGQTSWFGLGVSLVTLIAMLGDIRHDNEVRRQTGFADLPWTRRMRMTWRDMFDPNQA